MANGYTHGPKSRPPRGFRTTLTIGGRQAKINYVKWVKYKGQNLDGWCDPNPGEIWIATHDGRGKRNCKDHILDTIFHEATHWILRYTGREHGKDLMTDSQEEQVVLVLEQGQGGLLRLNDWLREGFNG